MFWTNLRKFWWTLDKVLWASDKQPPPLNILLRIPVLKNHHKGPITQLLVNKIHVFVNNKNSLVYESDEMSHSVHDQTPKCTSKKHFFVAHSSQLILQVSRTLSDSQIQAAFKVKRQTKGPHIIVNFARKDKSK